MDETPFHAFGGNTQFPNDMAFLAYLLDSEWYLGLNEHPGFIYYDERGLARDNGPGGRGSIYIYDLGYPDGPLTSVNYESKKLTHNIAIDVINKYLPRHEAWVREIIDILDYYRRAGQTGHKLNGWDYLVVKNKKRKSGMTDFYGTVIDVQFVTEVKKLPYDGFARESRRDYLKRKGVMESSNIPAEEAEENT